MTVYDRPVHGLASLALTMHRPLTALGKLAGRESRQILRSHKWRVFHSSTAPARLRNNKKEVDRNETNDIT